VEYKIEVVTVPVSDVGRALEFYTGPAGFTLDVDYHPAAGFRVSDLRHKFPLPDWAGGWRPGPDPGRRDYATFADFADPDGNTWTLQEIGYQGNGR
jgi:catechol 2,3-dioxygenase-like lactoylglutathione lyase family enzyme